MIKTAALALVVVACLATPAFAQYQDTVQIGDHYAYYMGNGVVRIPVLVGNPEHEVLGVSTAFLFSTTGSGLVADSITRSGRTYDTNIFDLFFDFSSPLTEPGGNPDSICAGMISITQGLPAGSGEIGQMWFSGAAPGDLISIIPRDAVGPCHSEIGYSGGSANPTFPTTHLQVIATDLAISCSGQYSVQATHLLTFPITVFALNQPVNLEITDFYGVGSTFPEPSLTGEGPWLLAWQPAFGNIGDWTLELQATDALGETAVRTVTIHVTEESVDPGDVYRGDMDCDGDIDITDLLILVNYMFNSGPPAACN